MFFLKKIACGQATNCEPTETVCIEKSGAKPSRPNYCNFSNTSHVLDTMSIFFLRFSFSFDQLFQNYNINTSNATFAILTKIFSYRLRLLFQKISLFFYDDLFDSNILKLDPSQLCVHTSHDTDSTRTIQERVQIFYAYEIAADVSPGGIL